MNSFSIHRYPQNFPFYQTDEFILTLNFTNFSPFKQKSEYSLFIIKVQYSTVQYGTVQYNTVQYITVQYCTVHYSTVQYFWNKVPMKK